MSEFLIRAGLAGIGVALAAGPLGCFVIWRGIAYIGDTMAHAALLGVALALLLNVNVTAGVFAVALAVALVLAGLEKRLPIAADTLLGILAHATLALGLIVLAFLPEVRVDLMGYLFGDILAVSWTDCLIILVVTVLVLGVLASIWRALLTATVSEEIAAAEGLDPARARVIFMVLLAAVIAAAMKIVGILLITALLIIPAAAARRFARGPEAMAVISAVCGVLAVVGGLALSWVADTPAGPSVVAAALLLFLASLVKRGD